MIQSVLNSMSYHLWLALPHNVSKRCSVVAFFREHSAVWLCAMWGSLNWGLMKADVRVSPI